VISATDFKNGISFEMDNNLYTVLEFQHVKPGKGAAFVRTKIKNLTSGSIVDRTFRPTEKFKKAHIERNDAQYLYSDNGLCHFMDNNTFEQISLGKDLVGKSLKFIKENETVKILSCNERIFGIEPPMVVDVEIIDTEPGSKGDTAQGATKPATIETGVTVIVPLFINKGDRIRVDTRTGEYTGRA
jgi:elongation factor P